MGCTDYSESLRGEDDELVSALIFASPESAINHDKTPRSIDELLEIIAKESRRSSKSGQVLTNFE